MISSVRELHQLSLRLTALLRRYKAAEAECARLKKTADRQATVIADLRRRLQAAEETGHARQAGAALRGSPAATEARKHLDAVIAQLDSVLAGLQD